MIFERLSAGGCQSYLIGCSDSCAAVIIDPEISLVDRYTALAARDGLRVHYRVTIEIEGGKRPACVAEVIGLHYR